MNTISYLKETYGYGVPIMLKDIRIGGKSKTSIRKELSHGVENGIIKRESQGIYYFPIESEFPFCISFEEIIKRKYIKNDYGLPGLDLDVYGYYTGITFLHQIGLTQQVPAVLEIVTNNTSCKRIIEINGYRALLRRGKIKIDRFNYRALQFFDLFYILDKEEIKKNYKTLSDYIQKYLSKTDFEKYISLYPSKIIKLIVEGGLINAFR